MPPPILSLPSYTRKQIPWQTVSPADRQTAETVERWTDSKSSKKAEVDSYKFVILNNCASDRVSGGRRRRAFRNRLIEIEREACSLEPAII